MADRSMLGAIQAGSILVRQIQPIGQQLYRRYGLMAGGPCPE